MWFFFDLSVDCDCKDVGEPLSTDSEVIERPYSLSITKKTFYEFFLAIDCAQPAFAGSVGLCCNLYVRRVNHNAALYQPIYLNNAYRVLNYQPLILFHFLCLRFKAIVGLQDPAAGVSACLNALLVPNCSDSP